MQAPSTIALESMTPEPFAYLTLECALADIGKTIGEAFGALGAALAQANVQPAGPPMARYSHFGAGRVTVDLGFPVREGALTSLRAAGLKTGATGGGKAMRAMHVGAYDTLRLTYDAVLEAIRKAGGEPAEEMWERYLSPPETAPNETRTEVLWPIKPAPASYE